MKQFQIDNIDDSIDTFSSILGNHQTIEANGSTDIIIPCSGLGVYECELNPKEKTEYIDFAYLYFKNVQHYRIERRIYDSKTHQLQDQKEEFNGIEDNLERNKEGTICIEGNVIEKNNKYYDVNEIYCQKILLVVPDGSKISESIPTFSFFYPDPDIVSFLIAPWSSKHPEF